MDDNLPEECSITILLQWAVTVRRWGDHRAPIVARLLERRQAEILASQDSGKSCGLGLFEDGEALNPTQAAQPPAAAPNNPVPNALPVFQDLLFRFLDTKAPIIGEFSDKKKKLCLDYGYEDAHFFVFRPFLPSLNAVLLFRCVIHFWVESKAFK
jgi:hypothetical protein